MGWDGAGGYTRNHNFSADASAGINILAARMDTEIDDIASAFTRVWTRDGQNVPTQDLPMGGRRFVNVGAPTSVSQFMRSREFIENIPVFMTDAESSADRISVNALYFTSVSANQAPGDGTRILVRAGSDKSSAALYLNGHSANVEYQDGTRAADSMVSGGIYEMLYSSVDVAWKITSPDFGRTAAERLAGVTPTNYQYPVGHMFRYGVPTDGASDCTPALNKAIAVAAQVTSGIRAYFPAIGTIYNFTTEPNDITGAMHVLGDGKTKTELHKAFSGGALLKVAATAGGTIIESLAIVDESGITGGHQITLEADASEALGMCTLRDLRLTSEGTDTHEYAIYVDGVLKTTEPIGVRALLIDGCDIFGGALGSIYLRSVVSARIAGTSTYPSGGSSGRVVVTGDGATNSAYVGIDGPTLGGIDLSHCDQVWASTSYLNGSFVRASSALRSGMTFIQGVEAIFERGGGNQVTARFNQSSGRAGLFTGSNSGRTFFGINLTHSAANVFNFDITGLAGYFGDPAGNGEVEFGCSTGNAGDSAVVGGAARVAGMTPTGWGMYKPFYPATPAPAAQTAAAVYAGSGAPNNAQGANGDFYFRSDGTGGANTVIYHKEGGSWVALVTA